MKAIIPIVAAACFLASCHGSEDRAAKVAAERTADSLRMEMVKKQTIDSVNAANLAAQQTANAEQPVMINGAPAASPVGTSTAVHHSGTKHTSHNSYTTNNNTYNTAPEAAAAPAEQKKKGWSAKATGAVIGTGAGALTGALVDKRRGEGAVIGGVIGAAAGLGTGAIIDKKKGR